MQKQRNSCYTYFSMQGDFDPEEISARLGLSPFQSWKKGDRRTDGTRYDWASWQYGKCDEYDIETANQMRRTIADLIDKTDILNQIRMEYDVTFFLEVVPTIHVDGVHPCLSPAMDIIDFCHATRTELDIDYYIVP